MEEELATLREEKSRLQEEIDVISEDLEMAASFGKTLLENNKEYEAKLEEISDEYTAAVTRVEVNVVLSNNLVSNI